LKIQESELRIRVGNVVVIGNLNLPAQAKSIVLFAHGSGSGRFSPRNQYVAKVFNKLKIATLLFDLLTIEEEQEDIITANYRFSARANY
jgi:putative phosphoribosyl transferase